MKLIEDLGTDKNNAYARYGLYECPDCKSQFKTRTADVKSGGTTRCKVCSRKMVGLKQTKHREGKTKLWQIWAAMKQRCLNPKNYSFKDYGGRGITVCQEWIGSYITFRDWAKSNGYTEGLTIDRIDNMRGYEPDNCRWTTMKVQASNRRRRQNSSSKERFVSFKMSNQKWQVTVEGIYIGLYLTEIEAIMARDNYIKNKI